MEKTKSSEKTYTTKELLQATGISEPTLRRWLAEKNRVPVLNEVKRDWRGNRLWTRSHVDGVLEYLANKGGRSEERPKGAKASNITTLPPPSTIGPEDLDHLGIKGLKEIAKKLNVPRFYSYTKDALVTLLKQMLTPKPTTAGTPSFTPIETAPPTYEQSFSPAPSPDGPFPIPSRYNENKIRLMFRDTHWVYTYWEVREDSVDHVIRCHPGKKDPVIAVRVFDFGPDARGALGYFDIDVRSTLGNWYIDTNRPGHAFKTMVGVRFSDGTYVPLAESNMIKTPTGYMSWVTDEKWMLYHEEFERLLSRYGRETPASPGMERSRRVKKVREWVTSFQPRFEESSGFVTSASHFFNSKRKRRGSAIV